MPLPAEHDALFRDWVNAHGGIVAKIVRAYSATPADAADLRQEILYQLWLSVRSFGGNAKPSTWIYRVCLNTAMTWRRGLTRRERRLDRDVSPVAMAASDRSPADAASERDLLDRLYAAIHALPPFDRALVLLSLDGVAYRDIADVTGLTENHVGVALTRARKRLGQLMEGIVDELE
jgi:RNA polymerase sigma-70 factor, ECF subfamily